MYDGAAAATYDTLYHSTDSHSGDSGTDLPGTPEAQPLPETAADRTVAPTDALHAEPGGPGTEALQAGETVVFIDSQIANYQSIAGAITSGARVVLFDGTREGIHEIAQELSGAHDLRAIDIISHGGLNQVQLGTDLLTKDTVSDHATDLVAIGNALAANGQIELFGCTIAGGDGFLAALRQATGHDIAASTDATGATALGGDWTLEASTGVAPAALPADLAALQSFDGLLDAASPPPTAPSEVVFIDPQSADLATLATGVRDGALVFVLDPDKDGIEQIADILEAEGLTDLGAIHLISHGLGAQANFGTTTLTGNTVSAHADALARIGAALGSEGDILLYGCDIGAGAEGQQFIADLARLTGADVAASTDATGSAALGGNWTLEASTGPIEAGLVFTPATIAAYQGLLTPQFSAQTGGASPFNGIAVNNISGYSQTIVGDWDGDGDVDLHTYNESTLTAAYYQNDGSGNFTQIANNNAANPFRNLTNAAGFNRAQNTYQADFDGDGDVDIWAVSSNGDGNNVLFRNVAGTFQAITGASSPFNVIGSVFTQYSLIGDWDGDGDVDILAYTGGADEKYFVNDGTGQFTDLTNDSANNPFYNLPFKSPFYSSNTVFQGDFDGDGDTDFWATEAAVNGAVDLNDHSDLNVFFRNDNGSFFAARGAASPFSGITVGGASTGSSTNDTAQAIVGDFDSDGDIDLLVNPGASGGAASYNFYANNGSGTFTLTSGANNPFDALTQDAAFLEPRNTVLADFDNDGDLDVWAVTSLSSQTNVLFEQEGTPPQLVSSSPADNATGVSPTANITLTFDSAVTKRSGDIYIVRTSDNTIVETIPVTDARVSGSGTTWTINPNTTLADLTGYSVRMDSGVFVRSDGIIFFGIDTNSTLNFTTAAGATISVNDVTHDEGDSGTTTYTFTVSLSAPATSAVGVHYATADGTASIGDGDYTATSGDLNFAIGEFSKTVTVAVNGDNKFEPGETFTLVLSNPTNATINDGSGLGTISNDDAQPTISINDVTLSEGNSGTTAFTFTVSLSNPSSQTVTVNYASADNSANSGSDYAAATGTLTFAPGETIKTITVLVNGDTTFEANETFLVNLTSPTNATIADNQGLGTVNNDDNAPPTASGLPTSIAFTEDTSGNLDLSAAIFSDIDSNSITVTLAASSGTMGLVGSGAVTLGGSGSGTVTISGTIAAVNTYLDTASNITYTPAADFSGTATLSVTGNDGSGNVALGTVNLNVAAVNDAPTLSATGLNPTYNEGSGAVDLFSGVAVSTVEAGQTVTSMTLTVTNVTDASEVLTFDGSSFSLVDGNTISTATNGVQVLVSVVGSTATVSFSGASLSVAAAATLVDGIAYRNTSLTPTETPRTVTLTQIVDSGGTANGGDNDTTLAIASTVQVLAINQPPVNTVPGGTLSFAEDAASSITGLSINDPDAGSAIVQVTLSVLHGILDVRTNVAGGVGPYGVVGDTTGTVVLTGTIAQINTTLAASGGPIYRPALNYTGSDTLTIVTNDLGNTGAPGALTDSDTVAITVNPVVGNTLSGDQTVALTGDTDGDGVADPGETVTVTIGVTNNSTTTDALGVSLAEILAGMTLSGPVKITPIGFDDAYSLTGNTPFSGNVLANDIDPDAATPLSNIGLIATGLVTGANTHGTVVLNTDGSFTYTPDVGYQGVATFSYLVQDAQGLFSNEYATVSLNVSGLVWYVDSAYAGGGSDGSYARPFLSLAPLNGAANNGATTGDVDGANQTIVVHGTVGGGITLENGQSLYGDGSSFMVNGHQVTNNGTHSAINSTNTSIITLGVGNTIDGIDVSSTNGSSTALQGTGNVGTLTVARVAISGAAHAIYVGGGTLNVSLDSVTSNGAIGANPVIYLSGISGTFTVTGDTSISNTGNTAITIANSSGVLDATFAGNMSLNTGANDAIVFTGNNNASQLSLTGTSKSITTTSGIGLKIVDNNGARVNLTGGGLAVSTTSGDAIVVTNTTAGQNTTFQVTGANNTVATSGTGQLLVMANAQLDATLGATFASMTGSGTISGSGIDLNNVDNGTLSIGSVSIAGTSAGNDGIRVYGGTGANVAIGTVTINGAGDDGIELGANTGSFTVTGGSIGNTDDPFERAVAIGGGTGTVSIGADLYKSSALAANTNVVSVNAHSGGNVTFSGNIQATGGVNDGILVQNNTGGTISFTGRTININTGASTGVNLTNNTGTTIAFNLAAGGNGLDITTTSGTGFNATGGGTVTVQGSGNTITTTTGTALNVTNTNIGLAGLTFQSISANGGTNGIVLSGTGTTAGTHGGLTVNGGTIQNTTGDSISLNSTRAVSLSGMTIAQSGANNAGNDNSNWIDATNVVGLTLNNVNATDSVGHGFLGNSVTNLVIQGGLYKGGGIDNVTNFSTVTPVGDANYHGFFITNLLGTSSITGATFERSNTVQFRVNNNTATNFAGTPDTLTVSDTTWQNHGTASGPDPVSPFHGDHLSVSSDTGGNFRLNVDSSIGQNVFKTGGTAVQAASSGTNGKMDVNVSGIQSGGNTGGGSPTFNGDTNTAMVVIAQTGGGSITYDILNNTSLGTGSLAIAVTHASSGGTSSGNIIGNTITHVAGPGTNAIQVTIEGTSSSGIPVAGGTGTVRISDNDITGNFQRGIEAAARVGTSVLNATIDNNTLTATDTTGQGLQAINVASGGSGNDHANTVRLNMHNNQVNFGPGATYTAAYRVTNDSAPATTVLQLQDFSGSTVADVQNWVTNVKANTGTPVSVSLGVGITASAGPIPTPPPPLLAAPGGVAAAPSETTGLPDTPADPVDETAATDPTSGEPTTPPADEQIATPAEPSDDIYIDDGVLSQAELDATVAAAIVRWAETGLNAEQIAHLQSVSFTLADLPGFYLGATETGAVTIDADAAGQGWYIDPTPFSDSEFANDVNGRLYTTPGEAPAGHLDLLTTVMHELGHQLGLADTYAAANQGSLMYGYLVTGERRLPGQGAAEGAVAGGVEGTDYLFAPISIGTLPAGRTITIQFQATVDSQSDGLITYPTKNGTINSSNFASANTNEAVVTLDYLTLGDRVFNDINANGVYDAGTDTGVDGVALTLYADTNHNNSFDAGIDTAIATTTTANGGLYAFEGLAPGDYIVQVNQANFNSGGVLEGLGLTSGGSDPDNNTDNDSNGVFVAGEGAVSGAITLAYNTEPANGTGNDTNNTVDFGFVSNLPPVVNNAGGSVTFTEGGGAVLVDQNADITVTDGDDADIASATVTISGGLVAGDVLAADVGATGINASYSAGVLTLSGVASKADYAQVLNSITFNNGGDDPTAGGSTSRTLTWAVNDGSANSAPVTSTITVTPINDAPSATAPASYNATEQVGLNLKNSGLSVGDVDGRVQTVTLSVTEGTLMVAAGTSGATVTNSGTSSVTIEGTIAQINALLNTDGTSTVSYVDNTDTPGATATLTLAISDNGNTGGGPLTSSATATIDIAAVPDPAVISNFDGDAVTYTEGGPAVALDAGSNAILTDVDTTNFGGGYLNLQFNSTPNSAEDSLGLLNQGTGAGQISIDGSTVSYGGVAFAVMSGGGAGGANLHFDLYGAGASRAAVEALIRTVTYANTNTADPATGDRIVRVSLFDSGAFTNTLVTVHVAAVNDAPDAGISPASYDASPGVPLNLKGNGLSVSDPDSGSADITVTLSVSEGTLNVTAGTSGVTSVAGSGTGSVVITGTALEINALLNSDGSSTVSYVNNVAVPAATVALTLLADDGGATGPVAETDQASATINMDAQPVFEGGLAGGSASVSFTENTAAGTPTLNGTVVFDVNANDGDGGATDTGLTFAITAGNRDVNNNGTAAFAIDAATGVITVLDAADLDFEAGPFVLTVSASDGIAPPSTATVTIDLNDVAETFTVTTLDDEGDDGGGLAAEMADGGGLSLREAIALANRGAGSADIITFAAGLNDQTIRLSNAAGTMMVAGPLTIDGDVDNDDTPDITITGDVNADDTLLAGGITDINNTPTTELDDNVAIMYSTGPSSLTLNGLVLTGGVISGSGGAVNAGADLVLTHSIVSGNRGYQGGGLFVLGNLLLSDSTVSNNGSFHNGGGIAIGDPGSSATVVGSTISGNQAAGIGGGLSSYGMVTVANSTISGNYAGAFGGGLFTDNATLTNVTVSGNYAVLGGGGVYGNSGTATIRNSTITGNDGGFGGGGGVYLDAGTITNSIVMGNTGASGEVAFITGLTLTGNNVIGTDLFSGTTDVGDVTLAEVFASVTNNPKTGVLSGTLANNGGTVQTVLIKSGGAAHDSGSNAALPTDAQDLDIDTNTGEILPVDARGLSRLFDTRVDLGAVELQESFNDAPVNTVPSTQTVNEDTDLVFSTANGNAISIADSDSGVGALSVILSVGNGVLTLSQTTGLSFTVGTGTADATMTFTGTLADINAALEGLIYRGAQNVSGSDVLSLSVSDLGNTGAGGAKSDIDVVVITIDAVNDAPVTTVPGPQSVNEDTSLAISGLSIADVDANGGILSVTLSVANGTLTLSSNIGLTFTGGTANGQSTLSFDGTVSDINAALAGLTYQGNLNFNGPDPLSISTNDQGNTGAGGAKTDVGTMAITVNAVNDAPVNTVPGPQTIAEDTDLEITGVSVADIDAGSADIIVTLTVAHGKITILDNGRGPPSEPTITDNGTNRVVLVGSQAAINTTLASSGGLTYRGLLNYNGPDTLTIETSDQGNSGAGGPLSDTGTVDINVTAVSDAPTGTDNTLTILEDTPHIFVASDFGFGDPSDSPANNLLAVKITTLPTAGTLTNNGIAVTAGQFVSVSDIASGLLVFTPDLNANGVGYSLFTFQVQDDGGTANGGADTDFFANTITFDVTAVNDAAIVSGTATGAATEAGGVGNGLTNTPTVSGDLDSTDVDNPNDTWTVESAGTATSNGYGTFEMTAGGIWTYTLDETNADVQALNVGDSLTDTFTVTTIDGTAQIVTVTVNGANDAAVVAGTSSGAVTEAGVTGAGTPTATGTLTDTDVDNTPDSFTAATGTGSSGYGTFAMTAGGTWTYTLDNTNAAVQALNVGDTLTDTFTVTTIDGTAQIVTVTINSANDAAIVSGTAAGSVTEAGGVGNGTANTPTATGTLTDTDVDNTPDSFTAATGTGSSGYGTFAMTAGGTWTYTLDETNADVQALNVGDSLTDTFTVTTIDGTAQIVTVTINGANDAAVVTSGNVTSYDVNDGGNVAINPTLLLGDVDGTSLSGATVTISAGIEIGDVLLFTNQGGITGSYDSVSGTLTLTGVASLDAYRAALASVSFASTTQVTSSRTIDFVVTDTGPGAQPSATATSTIDVRGAIVPVFQSGDQPLGDRADGGQGGFQGFFDRVIANFSELNRPAFGQTPTIFFVQNDVTEVFSADLTFEAQISLDGLAAPLGGDVVAVVATLADGSQLPDWLTFDPETGILSGQPPSELVAAIIASRGADDITTATVPGEPATDDGVPNGFVVQVVAFDANGNLAVTSVTLKIADDSQPAAGGEQLGSIAPFPGAGAAAIGSVAADTGLWLGRLIVSQANDNAASDAPVSGHAGLSEQFEGHGWRGLHAARDALLASLSAG